MGAGQDDNKENYSNIDWKYDELIAVLDSWDKKVKTISVSYDHPKQRCGVKEQIERAKKQFKDRPFGKLLLIKPSSETLERVDIKEILSCIYEFREFDILGLTEKELGVSIYRSGFTSLDQSTSKLRWTVSLVMPPI